MIKCNMKLGCKISRNTQEYNNIINFNQVNIKDVTQNWIADLSSKSEV